jgi:hypothetical protein
MSGQQPANVHLRRLLPLIAVVGLLGPGTALAANPSPDHPPAATAPAPDPAPVRKATVRQAPARAPAAVIQLTAEAPPHVLRPVTPAPSPKPRKQAHHVAQARHQVAVRLVDVSPSFVDLHPGLGALPRDESRLVLAAAALLAAAAAAGTGTMLTLTARVRR